jgi:hypothetical protein
MPLRGFQSEQPGSIILLASPSSNLMQTCTAIEGLVRIQYKCMVPNYVFPEMKLSGLVISKTD